MTKVVHLTLECQKTDIEIIEGNTIAVFIMDFVKREVCIDDDYYEDEAKEVLNNIQATSESDDNEMPVFALCTTEKSTAVGNNNI